MNENETQEVQASQESSGGDGALEQAVITPQMWNEVKDLLERAARPSAEGVTEALREKAASEKRTVANIKPEDLIPKEERQASTRTIQTAENVEPPRVVAKRSYSAPGAAFFQTFKLVRALVDRDYSAASIRMRNMAQAGMYDADPVRDAFYDENGEMQVRQPANLSSEGLPFLPTEVLNVIDELREQFGIARQLCTVWNNLGAGSFKVPNTTARPPVFAVAEGAMIKMRKPTMGHVLLEPKKWGVLSAYTTEMSDDVGAQYIQKVIEQVGRAFAQAEDETVWTADGTSDYHDLTGLFTLAGVGEYVMPAGNTTYSQMTRTDMLELIKKASYGERDLGGFAFHPDITYVMADFTDASGRLIYGPNDTPDRMIRPCYWSAALPGTETGSQAGTVFGTFGDHTFVHLGFRRGAEIRVLDQATIQDTDDNTLIHLGAQDSLALRFTARWDVKIGIPGSMARIKTAAT